MNGPVCGEPAAVGRWERVFRSCEQEVREVRCWVRGLLPTHCDVAFDAELAMSELAANAAVHSPATTVLAVLAHDGDGLLGELHELGHSAGEIAPDARAVTEMELLQQVPESVHVHADGLRESGRGLALVQRLCSGQWGVRQSTHGRITWFAMVGCRCQLRARHKDWGIIPGDGPDLWRAVRAGYPSLVEGDALQLMRGMREAERLGPLSRRYERRAAEPGPGPA